MSETLAKQIQRLEERRAGAWQEGAALLTTAETADRELDETERAAFDALMMPPDVDTAGAKIAGTGGEVARLDERIAKLKSIEAAGFKSQAVTRISSSGETLVDVKAKQRGKGTFWAFLAHCQFVHNGNREAAAAYARRQHDDQIAAWVLETPPDVIERAMTELYTAAAVSPGTTGDADFANKLTQVRWLANEFRELWYPKSICGRLALDRIGFDGAAELRVPGQSTGTIGYWVAESAPIPAAEFIIDEIVLTPKQMGVLSVVSNELLRRSTPQILGRVTDSLTKGAAKTVDARFMSTTAAGSGAPGGIRNGLSVITGTAGGTLTAIDTDAKAAIDVLLTADCPSGGWAWVMREGSKNSLKFIKDGLAQHAYRDEANAGMFQGFPIVESSNAPSAVLTLLAAPEIYWADELLPMIDVSGAATLELDDAPAGDGTGLRSMFQRNEQAIRLTMALDWKSKRAGNAATVGTLTW